MSHAKGMGLLAPYRLLDLTAGNGLVADRILGQLGMDIIKVTPASGSDASHHRPLWGTGPGPNPAIDRQAYGCYAHFLPLDLERPADVEEVRRLAGQADLLLEDFPAGYLDRLGLGYARLSEANPALSMVSITAFGKGPYEDYQASELTLQALSGILNQTGSAERPPVCAGWSTATHLVGLNAAVGCLFAVEYRRRHGVGQQVEVCAYDCALKANVLEPQLWDLLGIHGVRLSGRYSFGATRYHRRVVWPCKDGYVCFMLQGGIRGARDNNPVIRWMAEEGIADGMDAVDWVHVNPTDTPADQMRAWEETLGIFFRGHTKQELLKRVLVDAGSVFSPVFDVADALNDPHLRARSFWAHIEHPERGTIHIPGAFFLSSEPGTQRTDMAPPIQERPFWAHARRETAPASEPAPAAGSRKLLDGVNVVDLSWAAAGPTATKYLADFGAQVVKIESPDRPDIFRMQGPFPNGIPDPNASGNFIQFNSSKLSVPLNLKNEAGIALFAKLVAWADVVIENFKPGVMDDLGLGYERLRRINPRVIMVSISGWGQTGPYHHARGNAVSSAAAAGQYLLTGWRDGPPEIQSQGALGDVVPALFALTATLAALNYRHRTGRGQYIDVSQVETLLHTMSPIFLQTGITGQDCERQGNRNPGAAPHGVFRCKGDDSWCAIAVFTDQHWAALCETLGNPAFSRDSRFATFAGRKQHEDDVEAVLEKVTVRFDPWDLMRLLQKAGVPAGAVQTAQHFLDDSFARERQAYIWLQHPGGARYRYPVPPLRFSRAEPRLVRAPSLGQHTEMVCTRLLGLSDQELLDAMAAGAFGHAG